jgi:hypothetical protein
MCDSGAANGTLGRCNSTCTGVVVSSAPPTYPGTCPALLSGANSGFQVHGANTSLPVRPGASVSQRSFHLFLPPQPQGAPVVFTWHWYTGDAQTIVYVTGLSDLPATEGAIVVSLQAVAATPVNDTGYFEWFTGADPVGNPDLLAAEQVLACLHQAFAVNLDRVHAVGHSAGAIWVSYLAQHWSHRLASSMALSGGLQYVPGYRPAGDRLRPTYRTPETAAPMAVVWGGSGDIYWSSWHPNLSFEVASLQLSDALRADGRFTMECVGGFGHQLPPDQNGVRVGQYLVWPFFRDHPRGAQPYGSTASFPASFPAGWCSLTR